MDGPGHPLRHNRPSFPERERQSDDLIKNQRSSLVPLSAFRYSRRSTLTQFTLFFLLEANVIRQILVVYHERAVVYSLVASWSCTRLLNVTRFSLCVCVFVAGSRGSSRPFPITSTSRTTNATMRRLPPSTWTGTNL